MAEAQVQRTAQDQGRDKGRRPILGEGARQRLLADMPVTERRLLLAGISTAVLEGGDGPPVVLLHGPSGYAAHWMGVIPGLVATHRVIVPDLPGPRRLGGDRRWSAGRRPRAGVAGRADRAELHIATGGGRAIARRRHRGPLRHRPRRPAEPARARGHVRPQRVPAGAGVRARFARNSSRSRPRPRTRISGGTAHSISMACASGWGSAGSRSRPTTWSAPARRACRPRSPRSWSSSGCPRSRPRTSRGSPCPRP